jgi:hypothetical protein
LTGASLYYDVDQWDEGDLYPDRDGVLRPFPFQVELLDAGGAVLWRGRLREPLQIREYVAQAVQEYAGMPMSPLIATLVSSALKADLEALTLVVPDLPEAAALRFRRDLTVAEQLGIPGDPQCALDPLQPMVLPVTIGSQTWAEVPLAELPEVPLTTFTDLVGQPTVKRLWGGNSDPAQAVDVVILGDGFQDGQEALFDARAQDVLQGLLNLAEYATFSSFLNVYSVWTPSPDAGASFDCTCSFWDSASNDCTSPAPGCVDAIRKNVYGSVFTVRALYKLMPGGQPPDLGPDRNLLPLYMYRIGMAMSLDAPDGVPIAADTAVVVVNDQKLGAFGLFNAGITTGYTQWGNDFFGEVATHEMGHTFGMLGDEYSTSSDLCQVFELTPLFPNFSPIPDSVQDLAWAPWATLEPPYPNTEDQGTADDVGCFVPPPGGGVCEDDQGNPLVCRAAKTCKMKTNEGAFCPVCGNHVLKRIFRHLDLLDAPIFEVSQPSPGVFRLDVARAPLPMTATWSVDGMLVQAGPAYGPLDLDLNGAEYGPHEVRLDVEYASDAVRLWREAFQESMTVTVEKLP